MRRRCRNKDAARYGGRGIKVCDEWEDYTTFAAWATAAGYQDHLTIDRIDNDGNYEPSNCRWVDRKVQVRNSTAVKLDAEKVREIKRRLAASESNASIGRLFGVTKECIGAIKLGKTWRDIN